MARPLRHVAHPILALLVDTWCVPILHALRLGPKRPSDLENQLVGAPHSTLMRTLGRLHARGLASRERYRAVPPRTEYALTTSGRLLLDVASAAEHWEGLWADNPQHGAKALKLIGDEPTRRVLLYLASGASSAAEVEHALPISRSPLRSRLSELVYAGILVRNGDEGPVTYELSECARDLMLVSLAAARWTWARDSPGHPPPGHDIARVLLMFAPRTQLPTELDGVCRLDIDPNKPESVVHLAANGRRLAALPSSTSGSPAASCRATPHAWCDGLLLRRWCGVTASGDRALMAAVLASVSIALVA
jgi:DNA-binding HxlR family transcriptional regulator